MMESDYSQVLILPFPKCRDVFEFAERIGKMTEDELRAANGWPKKENKHVPKPPPAPLNDIWEM